VRLTLANGHVLTVPGSTVLLQGLGVLLLVLAASTTAWTRVLAEAGPEVPRSGASVSTSTISAAVRRRIIGGIVAARLFIGRRFSQ